MTFDPYEVLGVPKHAPEFQIKAAWREKLRRFHPDTAEGPTDVDQMVLLQKAYKILSDPDARKRFDETGLVDEEYVKRRRESVVKTLVSVFEAALANASQYGMDVESVDFVTSMKTVLKDHVHQIESKRDAVHKNLVTREKLKKRITRDNEEENLFAATLTSQIRDLNKMFVDLEEMLAVHKLALDELNLYSSPVDMIYRVQSEQYGYATNNTSTSMFTTRFY